MDYITSAIKQEMITREPAQRIAQAQWIAQMDLPVGLSFISSAAQFLAHQFSAQYVALFVLLTGDVDVSAAGQRGNQYGYQFTGLADLTKRIRSGRCKQFVALPT